jgi:flagellin-like hook-associated protein FlgL
VVEDDLSQMSISIKSNAMGTQHSLELGRRIKTSQDSTLRMSSGFRIVNPYDDAGELSVSAKVESSADAGAQLGRQMLNSLSFLNTQKGLLENVSSILSKALDLRSSYNNPVMTEKDKNGYDEAFRELQKELNQISRQKFNDVSIFSTQLPGELIGDSVGLDKITQQSDALNTSDNIGVSRWGIFRDLSVNYSTNDTIPGDVEVSLGNDFLAFTFTDESRSSSLYKAYYDDLPRYQKDLENWENWVSDQNINIKIAAVVTQQSLSRDSFYGGTKDGGPLLPKELKEETDLPSFVSSFRGMVRESGGQDPYSEELAVEFLKNAFLDVTKNGTNLPKAVGFFVDNSGSQQFTQVNQAVFRFKEWINDNYGPAGGGRVLTSSVTDSEYLSDIEGESAKSGMGKTGWVNGVWMAGYEDWIEQSRAAIENLISLDGDIKDSLDNEPISVPNYKGLLDDTYSLKDFSVDELEVFLERVSDALAQNGAETQAAQFAIDEIANLSALRSQATSRSIDTDYSTESTRLIKNQFLIEGGAVLLNKFKNLTATALTVLGA